MRRSPTSYRQLQSYSEENRDYRISESPVRSKICVFSPHGGKIEPGVSELVQEVASGDFSWYLFEGIQTSDNFLDLHITSHLFDEPRAVSFVRRHRIAVAIHGKRGDNSEATYLGGRNIQARNCVGELLRKTGFNVPIKTPPNLLGEEPNNICNQCLSGEGVQLEITQGQRERFFVGDFGRLCGRRRRTVIFTNYVDTLRIALSQLNKELRPL